MKLDVVFRWKDVCFIMKVLYVRVVGAASDDSECVILNDLEFVYVGF